jgi:hypothetical protein
MFWWSRQRFLEASKSTVQSFSWSEALLRGLVSPPTDLNALEPSPFVLLRRLPFIELVTEVSYKGSRSRSEPILTEYSELSTVHHVIAKQQIQLLRAFLDK